MSAKQKLRKLELRREKIGYEIADLLADREAIDERIARKSEREPQDEQRQKQIDADLRRLRLSKRATTGEIERKRSRRSKVTRKAKRTARRLRNRISPKVIRLNLSFSGPTTQRTLYGSIGHHTAGPTDDNDAEAERLWRQYHAAHRAKGWSGIGYHIGLSRDGSIFLLRPLNYVGAHTYGHNTGRVGIVCHGTTGDEPTKAQQRALRAALKKFHLEDKPVGVHNDFNSTACPATHTTLYRSKGAKR